VILSIDSPHIEANEIIGDSEDEEYGHVHWNSMYFPLDESFTCINVYVRASASKSAEPFQSADIQQRVRYF